MKGPILSQKGEPERADPRSGFALYTGGFTIRLLLLILLIFFVKKRRIQLKLTGIFQNTSTCKLASGAHRFTEEEAAWPEGAVGVCAGGSCAVLPGLSTGFSLYYSHTPCA